MSGTEKICGTCRYFEKDSLADGDYMNENSDSYGCWVGDFDACGEWEARFSGKDGKQNE